MKLHYSILVGFVVALAATTSCSPDATTSARIAQFEKKIEAQNAAIAQFEHSTTDALNEKSMRAFQILVEHVTTMVTEVRGEVSSLRQSIYAEKTATLDPASKGYSSVATDRGVFLFRVDNAEPFLDGHKIILSIGNPMNMTFSGFKLKVRYGKRPPALPPFDAGDTNAAAIFQKWGQDRQAWEKTVRKTEIPFTDSLQPGAWNKVDFTLKETKPEDVAHLEVGIETDQIALRKPLNDLK